MALNKRFDHGGMDIPEIMAATGLTRNQVKGTIESALQKLRKYFTQHPEVYDMLLEEASMVSRNQTKAPEYVVGRIE